MDQKQYLDYLTHIHRKGDGAELTPGSVDRYGRQAMNFIDKYIPGLFPDAGIRSIFDIDDLGLLIKVKDALLSDPGFAATDKRGKQMYSVALNHYMEFARGNCFTDDKVHFLDTPVLPISDFASEPKSAGRVSPTSLPRDRIKVVQLGEACGHRCQVDKSHRTFISEASGNPYVEGHHIIPLSEQGFFRYDLDCYANIIVLCPTCHRFFHYARKDEREEKLKAIYDERAERLANSGIVLDRHDFLEAAGGRRPSGVFTSF